MPAMVQNVPAAFQALLDERGLSVSGLSKMVGDPNTLGKMFARGGGMRTRTLALVAEKLEISIDDLTRLLGLPSADATVVPARGLSLPVRFVVQAGAYFAEDHAAQDVIRRVAIGPDPRYPVTQWLEEVRGDSVDLILPEGGLAQVADWYDTGVEPRDGMLVIARATREGGHLAERTIKAVQRNGRRVELWPRSSNPRWSKPVIVANWGEPTETDNGDLIELVGLVIATHRYL